MRWLAVLLISLFLASPAQAGWREAKTPHFLIYSSGSEKGLREFAINIERFDHVLRERFGIATEQTPQRLTIFLMSSSDEVQRAMGGGKDARNVAGFYTGLVSGSLAVVDRRESDQKYALDGNVILFHEYAHHFMFNYFSAAYPAWYIEGFAEFFATTDFTPEGNAKIGLPAYYRAYGLVDGPILPLEKLLTANPSDLRSGEAQDAFYGRAWLLVHYLDRAVGREGQLSQYLNGINAGKTSLEAAQIAFGDLKLLDKEIAKYMHGRLTYATRRKPTPAPTELSIASLSPAASESMLIRLRSMRGVDLTEAKALVPKFKAIADKYPDDGDAWFWLAQGYADADQDAEAEAALANALRIKPGHSRALLLRGEIAVRKVMADKKDDPNAWKAARSLIVKANRADVNDPLPLFRYYESWKQQGIAPPQTAKDGLRRVFTLVPESSEVRFAFAGMLANDNQYETAINVIKPLAFDPHNNGQATVARKLLDQYVEANANKANAAVAAPAASK
jgi:tetratricopeptide (TPR) repeat protein